MSSSDRLTEIWDTAERLFSQYGYHATTMRRIAGELGLEGGSLYAHIDSKQEILEAVVGRIGDGFLDLMRPVLEADAPPDEKLRMAMRAHVRMVAENLEAATVYFHDWRFLDAEHRAAVVERRDTYEEMFRSIIREGAEAGVFREVDSKFATILILSAGNWVYQWYDPDGQLTPEEIADRFSDIICEGLCPDCE